MAANNLGTAYIKIAPQMDGIQSAITNAIKGATKSGSSLSTASIAIGNVISKGISTAVGAVTSSIDGAIRRTDIINNFSKVMSNMGIGADASQKSIDTLVKKLDGLPTALQDGASAVQRFTSRNGDIQKSTDIFLALNNALLAGGQSTEQQATALEQLSQAYAKGKPDMMEWRSMQQAMPAQLRQIAEAMGYGANGVSELGEALRKGEVSMDSFMDTIIDLNQKGTGEFKSFEEQARNSTAGIGTALKNVQNRIAAAIQKIINAFGSKDISDAINKFSSSFSGIADWIAKNIVPIIKNQIIPAFKNMFSVISNVVSFIKSNTYVSDILKNILTAILAFKSVEVVGTKLISVGQSAMALFTNLSKGVEVFKNAYAAGMTFSSSIGAVAGSTTGASSAIASMVQNIFSWKGAIAGLAVAGILGVQAAIIGCETDTIRATTAAREYARAHYTLQQAAESAKRAQDLLKQSINDVKNAEMAANNAELAALQYKQQAIEYEKEMGRLKQEGKENTDEYRIAQLNYNQAILQQTEAEKELTSANQELATAKQSVDDLNSSGLYKANLMLAAIMREGEEYGTLAAKLDELKTKTTTYRDEYGNMVEGNLEKSREMAEGIAEQLANSETKTGEVWRNIVDIANTQGISYAEAAAKYGAEAGNNLPGNFAEGVRLNTSLVTDATTEAGKKAINEMRNSVNGAYDVGKNLTQGAANGINDKSATSTLWSRAKSVITTAIARMRAAADEHSPSKKTAEIGKFMSLGLAKGIDDYADEAVSAAQSATQAALGAFNGGDGFGINSTSATPYSASGGLAGGNPVTQYNTFNQVDTNLDMQEISKRLGWQVATAL